MLDSASFCFEGFFAPHISGGFSIQSHARSMRATFGLQRAPNPSLHTYMLDHPISSFTPSRRTGPFQMERALLLMPCIVSSSAALSHGDIQRFCKFHDIKHIMNSQQQRCEMARTFLSEKWALGPLLTPTPLVLHLKKDRSETYPLVPCV